MSELLTINIEKVECQCANSPLYQLTFHFPGNIRSPPLGSYTDSKLAEDIYSLPGDKRIGAVEFGMTSNPFLIQLGIYDRDNTLLKEFKGSFKIKKSTKIILEENEHIVSADVETNGGSYTESVQFIIFRRQQKL